MSKTYWISLVGVFLLTQRLLLAADTMDETMGRAIASLQADIARDTEALIALRSEIGAAREPLARQLSDLQAEAAALRVEQGRLQRLRQQGERDQTLLRERAAAAQESLQYAETLLTEYARALDTRIGLAEAALLGKELEPMRNKLSDAHASAIPALAEQLLQLAQAWNTTRLGGHSIPGIALDADGVVHAGQFAIFGPMAFFAGAEAEIAGIAISRLGRLEPGIHPLPRAGQITLRQVLDGASASVPADVTGGDAIRMEQSRVNPIERLRKGGFVMIPLLITGFVALLLAVWKTVALLRLHRAVAVDIGDIPLFLQQGNLDRARARAAEIKAPLFDIMQEAIIHRGLPREHLEEILHEHVINILPQAERHLGTLAVLGGVAPLLGLLGTVTGMIHTFQLVTLFGSGDARMLSGGISEALITTETGLIIAVPVLLAQAFLARGARSVVATLERQALTIVNHLHARGSAT